jgi:prefoldin subunit 5
MNRERRKIIAQLVADLQAMSAAAAEIQSQAQALMDEEQEAFDNLSESLQSGERGQAMEAAVEALGEASDGVEAICSEVDTTIEALERAGA